MDHILATICENQLNNYPNFKYLEFINYSLRFTIKKLIGRQDEYSYSYKYSWPNALITNGLISFYNKHKELNSTLFIIKRYYDEWIECGQKILFLDCALHGETLIDLFEITGEKKYLQACDKLFLFLKFHKKNKNGALCYRNNSDSDLLVDSIGMICPFLMRYHQLKPHENLAAEISKIQIHDYLDNALINTSFFPYQGYDKAGNVTGIAGWGRGLAWLMMGLASYLKYSNSNDNYVIKNIFEKMLLEILARQDCNGLLPWVFNEKQEHIDTSTTSMIFCSVAILIRCGLLDKKYQNVEKKALHGLLNNLSENGIENCSAECQGPGKYPQNYGSYPWSYGPTLTLLSYQ